MLQICVLVAAEVERPRRSGDRIVELGWDGQSESPAGAVALRRCVRAEQDPDRLLEHLLRHS